MISIIVPIYNARKYLNECIRSVVSQDFPHWELLLIDDGSNDGSAGIARRYADGNRIRYFHKTNSGVTEARWLGVEKSSGDILMFLDADDILLSNALQIVNDNMDDTIDILSFSMQSFTSRTTLRPVTGHHFRSTILMPDSLRLADSILSGDLLSCVWGGAYKRGLVASNRAIFCNGLRIAEDTMFNLELAVSKAPVVKWIDAPLYGYRENNASVMHSVSPQRFDAAMDAIHYMESFGKRHPDLSNRLSGPIAFRILLLWSTFMFHPENQYYRNRQLRKQMRKLYFAAFKYLYPYLKVYLFIDLFISKKLSQRAITFRK